MIKVKFDNFKISVACKKKLFTCLSLNLSHMPQNIMFTKFLTYFKTSFRLVWLSGLEWTLSSVFRGWQFHSFSRGYWPLANLYIVSLSKPRTTAHSWPDLRIWWTKYFCEFWPILSFNDWSLNCSPFFLRQFLTTLSETSEWRFFIQNSTIESISIAVDVFICLKKIILPRVSQSIDKQF